MVVCGYACLRTWYLSIKLRRKISDRDLPVCKSQMDMEKSVCFALLSILCVNLEAHRLRMRRQLLGGRHFVARLGGVGGQHAAQHLPAAALYDGHRER